MARLGNSFPEERRREYVQQKVVPGIVLYLRCDFANRSKEKYVVLACVAPMLGFMINSRVTAYVSSKPYLAQSQIPLAANDYDFLRHGSFIDCSTVWPLDCAAIWDELLNDTGRIRGQLKPATILKMLTAVRMAKTISPAHKELITSALAGVGTQ